MKGFIKHITALIIITYAGGSLRAQPPAFVRVQGAQFTIDHRPYYFVGANMWYAGLLATGDHAAAGRERLDRELGFLQQQGINNIRVLLGAEGNARAINGVRPVHPALQPQQGQYDETLFDGLDYLLLQLHKRNMFVVFILSNNWEWSGGFLQYLSWNKQLDTASLAKKYSWDEYRDYVSRFYSCPDCMTAYQQYVQTVLQHRNKLTGKQYRDEPAIMAWEVANEPRPMRPAAAAAYQDFLQRSTALIKSIDKNHLVTLGTEGVMGTESEVLYEAVHRDKNVDYCTIHIWPKNWGWFKGTAIAEGMDDIIKKGNDYIRQHIAIATAIGKPLVIEEFGLPRDNQSFDLAAATTQRDKWYAELLARWNESVQQKGVLAGVSFWSFGGEVSPLANQVFWKEGDAWLGDPPMEEQGLNSVFEKDRSTWTLIDSFINKAKQE